MQLECFDHFEPHVHASKLTKRATRLSYLTKVSEVPWSVCAGPLLLPSDHGLFRPHLVSHSEVMIMLIHTPLCSDWTSCLPLGADTATTWQ